MKKHGKDNPDGMHAGDLPNFNVGANGKGKATMTAAMGTLGDGMNSLFHAGGTALVIHAGPDVTRPIPREIPGPDRLRRGGEVVLAARALELQRGSRTPRVDPRRLPR